MIKSSNPPSRASILAELKQYEKDVVAFALGNSTENRPDIEQVLFIAGMAIHDTRKFLGFQPN